MMPTIAEAYGLKVPKPFGYKGVELRGTNPELMMGIELEIENLRRGAEDYMDDLNTKGWQVTTDDSLRGANNRRTGVQTAGYAYEFISRPMAQAHLLHGLEEFFKVVPCTTDNYTDRTSVHVHVNCLDMTHEQVQCLALLYTVVEDIMFQFVGNDRDQNIYCIPWKQCRLNHDMLERMEIYGKTAIKQWQKYTALNLLPLVTQGTVEFRHMNGTCDIARLHQWLNMIGALFAYAKRQQLTTVISEIKALNSTSEYQAFFGQVFQDSLAYNDTYRESLESGTVTAKYSLINWKKKDKRDAAGRQYTAPDPAQQVEVQYDAPNTMDGILANMRAQQQAEAARVQYRTLFENAAPFPAPAAPEAAPPRPARPLRARTTEPAAGAPVMESAAERATRQGRNMFEPWPANGRRVFIGGGGFTGLSDQENRTLQRNTGLWQYQAEALRILVIGQPANVAAGLPAGN